MTKGRKVYQSLTNIEAMKDPNNEGLRIDRWLWFCRFFKTRGLAASSVSGGHVKINGERAKPGYKVKKGDIIELMRDQLPYKLMTTDLPLRRGPAIEARQHFEEDAAVASRRAEIQESIRQDRKLLPTTDGRPDKHTRRQLRKYNRGHSATDQNT